MAVIHKSATKACDIAWKNGNHTVLWVGHNHNTGDTIVWQMVIQPGKHHKSSRITGRNIAKLAAEIAKYVPAEGQFVYRNAAAMSAIA
jgi:hypothetical protein